MGSVETCQCNTQISLVHLSPRSINLSQISCFCFLVSPHQVLCYTLCTYCLSSSQQSCKTGFTIFVSCVRKQCPRALLISPKSTNQGLTSLLQGTILRITNLWFILEVSALSSFALPTTLILFCWIITVWPAYQLIPKEWWGKGKLGRSCHGLDMRDGSCGLKEIEEPKIIPHFQPESRRAVV